MAHQIVLMKDGKKRNITQLIGSLAWSSNIDALGVELSFNYAFNDSLYFEDLDLVEVGDQIALLNGSRFIGYFIVINSSVSGRFGKTFTCFDRAWYLNKNETVIQFKRVSASQAIAKLLDKFRINHKIASMPTSIKKIYKDMTVGDIILDILDQVQQETGVKYQLEMERDVLSIMKQGDLTIKPMIRLSDNNPEFPVTATVSVLSRSRSIEEMKNNVLVVADGEESVKVYTQAADKNSTARYGQLTEVVTLDQKNASQARNIAANTLMQLNRVGETVSCELLGHDDIRAGRVLELDEPVTGTTGNYLIKSANHTVNNGIHRVAVELEAI